MTSNILTRRVITKGTLGALFLLMSGVVWCNQYKEMSLEDKVKASDLVVIAQVSSVSKQGCKGSSSCAKIEVSSSLKGKPAGQIVVLFDGPIAEFNPRCCEAGETYLFFLERLEGNIFRSANGPFGIYRVGPIKADRTNGNGGN